MDRPNRVEHAINAVSAPSHRTLQRPVPRTAASVFVLTMFLAAIGNSRWAAGQEASEEEGVRSVAAIHRQLRKLEAETAKLDSDAERARNIAALCGLFVEIGEHPELRDSPTLQSLSVRLRTRLRGIDRRTVNELRRRQIPEPPDLLSSDDIRRARASRVAGLASGGLPNRGFGIAGNHTSQHDQSSEEHRESRQEGLGGRESGHAAPGPDYGWQLVNLIRHTIRPDYWSVAGGPGKAIYFGHSRALVIHGSWRVQEDVADLLSALRGYE